MPDDSLPPSPSPSPRPGMVTLTEWSPYLEQVPYTHALQGYAKPCRLQSIAKPEEDGASVTAHGPATVVVTPQELVDYALDFLSDDIPTLKKAALVCHSWLPRCQKHLLRRISFYPNKQSISLPKQISVSPHFVPLVEELTVSLQGDWLRDSDYYSGLGIPEIPRELVNLRKLTILVHMPLTPTLAYCLHSASLGIPRIPALRTLPIVFPHFQEVEIVLALQKSLQSTITLSVPAHTLDQYSDLAGLAAAADPDAVHRGPLPQVKEVKLLQHGIRELEYWLLSIEPSVDFTTCHTCAISLQGWHAAENLVALGAFTFSIRDSLKHLSIDFEGVNGREELFQDLSSKLFKIKFNELHCLRTLHLRGVTPFLAIPSQLRASKLLSSSNSLEEFSVTLSPLCIPSYYSQRVKGMKFRPAYWRGVDDIFASEERYPRLRRVHFDVQYDSQGRASKQEAETARTMFATEFPLLKRKSVFSSSLKQKWYSVLCQCKASSSWGADQHIL